MQFDLDVMGLDDSIRALEGVEQKTSIRVTRSALRFAAKPAVERAKQLVAYDNSANDDGYHLRDTIGLKAESKKNRAGNATTMRFGAHRQTTDSSSQYRIAGGLGKSIRAPNHAQLVNKETPFLEPAINSTLPQILRRFGEKIKQSVSKL